MKSILFSLLFASLFFSIIFSSCQPVHYIPNMDNVAVLRKKGEGSVSLGISTSGRDSLGQYSLHTSYLFTNHFAVNTNSVLYKFPSDFQRNRTRNSGQIHELGIGYVHNLEDKFLNFAIWGIVGTGKMNTILPRRDTKLSTDLFLLGINPTASVVTKYYSTSFSMKSFFLHYTNIEGNLFYSGINEVKYMQNNDRAFIIEPTFTQQIGFRQFKFVSQTTLSRNLMFKYRRAEESKEASHDRQVNILISFGINYNFYTRKRETPTEF